MPLPQKISYHQRCMKIPPPTCTSEQINHMTSREDQSRLHPKRSEEMSLLSQSLGYGRAGDAAARDASENRVGSVTNRGSSAAKMEAPPC
ncbi:hypothetical protein CDAR_94511 [Caerostris darwini]|uniref:Uncharacterized protein n=1 Tax=Caerostris darwini TaxID=1538125 RepID=A0AAV4NC18_9ARAC|nr:hypothetical protein CDAR_94511 [Caerostris darwini]